MRVGRVIAGVTATAAVAAAAWAGYHYYGASASGLAVADQLSVPTTKVVRGAIEMSVHTIGDLRAMRSMVVQAPPVAGGVLRIMKMVDAGSPVKAGDVIMEFDPTEQLYLLEQSRSELAEADQTIAKMAADREVQAAQEQVDLQTARFDVRRAELDALPDRDLIAPNEYQRRQLSLEEARRKLTQLEETAKSRTETSAAALAVAVARRTKSKMAADRAETSIGSLLVKAPMDGYLVPRENQDAAGGFFYSGMQLPSYRAGDNVYPGRPVADVLDISHMEVRAKVNELERVNVAAGQAATVQADSLPGVALTAKVKAVSGTTSQSDFFFDSPMGPLRQFEVTLQIDQSDERLHPGTTVHLLLTGNRVDNVLNLPRQAIFERNGKPIVYAKTGDHFEPVEVKPTQRSEGRIALEPAGRIAEGLEVALVKPDSVTSGKKPDRTAAPAQTGGPK